jgi:hypothetical protein
MLFLQSDQKTFFISKSSMVGAPKTFLSAFKHQPTMPQLHSELALLDMIPSINTITNSSFTAYFA